jgi:hypothetical protein
MEMRKILDIERGSIRSHRVKNSLWKRLWTCRKAYYVTTTTTMRMMMMMMKKTLMKNTDMPHQSWPPGRLGD